MYADAEWAALGFTILDPTLQVDAARKLKLKKHPPTSKFVTLLKGFPPGNEATARQWFQALSRRVSCIISYLFLFESALICSLCLVDFSPAELRELPDTPFIPVKSTEDSSIIKNLRPNQCFLRAATSETSELYSKLFSFVDFGASANIFLQACGARQEPSIEDFAQLLLAEPRRIYNLANGRDK